MLFSIVVNFLWLYQFDFLLRKYVSRYIAIRYEKVAYLESFLGILLLFCEFTCSKNEGKSSK